MGATPSRHEDASLGLAVPKYTKIGPRRLLDTKAKNCAVCHQGFGLLQSKHYCRRCGGIVCEGCTVMRRYKQRNGYGFRVCHTCNNASLFDRVPAAVWALVMEFAGPQGLHHSLQSCRRMQIAVPLPYKAGASWDDFFVGNSFISKGANGSVYRSTMREGPHQGQSVAVKVIQKSSVYSQRKWSHLEREIRALQVCKHRNVIEILGTYQNPESVFLVLQYANGGDLFDWLMTRKAPSEAEIIPIAQQLLAVLHHMHFVCNAVHRDIKPENILLERRVRGSETPTIRLADFGFARIFPKKEAQRSQTQQLTGNSLQVAPEISVAATPCGTLGFAAPEIIVAYSTHKENVKQEEAAKAGNKPGSSPQSPTSKRPPSAPTTPVEHMKKMDIFAAGVTFCILLTGCEPFPCNSSKAHLDAVKRGVSFSGRHWSHVSREAKELIRRMLHPDATQRPTSHECMASTWLNPSGMPLPGLRTAAEEEETARSYQQSVRSLRKNDGTVFVSDRDGTVQRKPRADAYPDELDVPRPHGHGRQVPPRAPSRGAGPVAQAPGGSIQLQQQPQQQQHSQPQRQQKTDSSSMSEAMNQIEEDIE